MVTRVLKFFEKKWLQYFFGCDIVISSKTKQRPDERTGRKALDTNKNIF